MEKRNPSLTNRALRTVRHAPVCPSAAVNLLAGNRKKSCRPVISETRTFDPANFENRLEYRFRRGWNFATHMDVHKHRYMPWKRRPPPLKKRLRLSTRRYRADQDGAAKILQPNHRRLQIGQLISIIFRSTQAIWESCRKLCAISASWLNHMNSTRVYLLLASATEGSA